MTETVIGPEYWLERAREARNRASTMNDEALRWQMLAIAYRCELLAAYHVMRSPAPKPKPVLENA